MRTDDDQLCVVLGRLLADLLDSESVGGDRRAVDAFRLGRLLYRSQEPSHAMGRFGLGELDDDVRVAIGGVADRGHDGMHDGDH